MVYEWEAKREMCYVMYIEEKRSLEEIMEYMKTFHQFSPSKRAFQTQFKRWGFPSKQNPAHKNAPLVARIKELWEHNVNQRDMLHTLHSEGYDIKERELMRVRSRHRWLLRVPNGTRIRHQVVEAETEVSPQTELSSDGQATHGDGSLLALQHEMYRPTEEERQATANAFDGVSAEGVLPDTVQMMQDTTEGSLEQASALTPEAFAKRKERLARLQLESAERWAARKRRRRTKSWAGLPADPPGPPRFPSETTIDESKQFLQLDNELYREVRERFQSICQEYGFLKKTVAGPERWQAAKDRLINEIPHLQALFWGSRNEPQADAKALALDVLCTDVTKRMRTVQRRMTIAEAKNALGVNPDESRQLRNTFYQMLQDDHFTSKFEAGDAHWSELKQRWIGGSPILQAILAPGPADPTHSTKQRAIEVLGRDVLKRLRDDQTRRGLGRRKSSSLSTSGLAIGNVQTTATNQATPEDNSVNDANTVVGQDSGQARIRNGISTLASQALASESIMTDLQIDPSLLQAAAREPAFAFAQQGQQPVPEQVQQNPLEAVASGEGPAQPLEGEENLGLAPHPPSMPVYPHTYVHDAAGMVHPSQPPDVSQQAASGAQEDAPSSIR